MHQGFRADAFVSISTPSTTRFLVEKFVQLNQLDGEVETRLCAELERRYGATLWTDYAPVSYTHLDVYKRQGHL